MKSGARWGGGFSPSFFKGKYILLEKIASSACGRVYGLFFFTVNSVLKHVMVIRETLFCVLFFKGLLIATREGCYAVTFKVTLLTLLGGRGYLTVTSLSHKRQ